MSARKATSGPSWLSHLLVMLATVGCQRLEGHDLVKASAMSKRRWRFRSICASPSVPLP